MQFPREGVPDADGDALHMIGQYARYCGHADLLGERDRRPYRPVTQQRRGTAAGAGLLHERSGNDARPPPPARQRRARSLVTSGQAGPDRPAAHLLRSISVDLALVAAATAGFFFVPVPGPMRASSLGILFGCGVAALGILIALAVRRLLSAGENARIRTLLMLLVLTVLFFSWSDAAVGQLPGQFSGLHTRIDGLYFTIATLATVGFGDVHASGQLARAAVTVQIVFNLVFLSTAAAMITGFVRARARSRAGAAQSAAGNGGDTSAPGDQDGAG